MDLKVAKIVGAFYEANLSLAEWTQPLMRLQEVVEADACAIATHDFAEGKGRILHAVGIDPGWVAAYETQHGASNVWFQNIASFERVPAVVDGRDVASPEAVRASSFYHGWLAPLRLGDHVFVVVERQKAVVRYVACGRREAHGPFSDASRALLHRLAPDLHRAFVAGRAIRVTRHIGRLAADALDAMPMGVALVNAEGAVVTANRPAHAIINDGDALYVCNGGLAFDRNGRRTRLSDLISSPSVKVQNGLGREPVAQAVSRPSGKRPLTMILVPQTDGDCAPDYPVATVYLGDPDRAARFEPDSIARLYGLSRAESRVAALLASGYRLEQISQILGVAYETVRKHLKQIFGKTGTYRQAELVRMLVSGPAALSL